MANFLKSLFIKGVEIDTAGAIAGDVLKYDGSKFGAASAGGGSSVGNLDDLTDVIITTPLEFQTLEYNGTNWVNANAPSSVYVRNAEATTITTGTCVYLFGATGDHATVKRADKTSDTTSAKTVGVVSSNILASENGVVVTQGYVDGIDLSTGYTSGDVLWLGDDGAFTTTKAIAPDHLVFIGVVVRATNNGIIYVATQNGYELDELHNVSLPSPQSGEFLKYNGSLWVADAIDLGTDTTGNYVGTITAGTGVTTSGASTGEGIAHSISIGQAIGTSDSPTFAGGVFTGNTSTDLVRITQTGTGNALVVEDSTNPDATPFVINSAGNVVVGHTSTSTTSTGVVPKLQLVGLNNDSSSSIIYNFANDSTTTVSTWAKSRGGSFGTQGAAANADAIGNLNFEASDGTQLRRAAQIIALVDATPSAGVVQGRLQFQTANSAGIMTERMRIDSAGNVSIGTTTAANYSVLLSKNITGAANSWGIVSQGQIQSDVTGQAVGFTSASNTAATGFTLTSLVHFQANGTATPGTGSTITAQTGFQVSPNTTGATSNFGFRGQIASGTGRYNLFMDGTADNYLAGRLGVGATLTSGAMAQVTNTTAADKALVVKGAASQSGSLLELQNSAGTVLVTVDSSGNFVGPVSSIKNLGNTHSSSFQARADSSAQGLLAGYSFYPTFVGTGDNIVRRAADISAGFTGAWATEYLSFGVGTGATNDVGAKTTERMRIDGTGNVGIGTTSPSYLLHMAKGTASIDTIDIAVDVLGGNAGDSAGYVMRAVNTNELGAIRSYVETGYLSNMRFFTAGATNVLTERMRIDSVGNVGVGTNSPTEKLDVAGNIALTGSVVFEGATADNFETTLSVTNPTADRTITLPDASGAVALITVSDTAPTAPATGSLWYKSSTGVVYIYYDLFWIEVGSPSSGIDGGSA